MREIKFRIWDSEKQKMTKSSTLYDYIEAESVTCTNRDKYPIMQYTGIKDVDGKEIYEGDILGIKKYPLVVSFNDNFYGSVWGWNLLNPDGTPDCYYYGNGPSNDYDKILGNIYENPDLMVE